MDPFIILSGWSALPEGSPHPKDARGWKAGESPAGSWPITVPWLEQQKKRDTKPTVQHLYVPQPVPWRTGANPQCYGRV